MLKHRLIPVLFLKNGWLVRSESFCVHQKLGNPVSQVERYNTWSVDELIYLDITSDNSYDIGRDDLGGPGFRNPPSLLEIIERVSHKCFMPLTCGGNIQCLDDIRQRLEKGADKITLNTKAVQSPDFITEAAHEFGSQAIIVAIDVNRHADGHYEVYRGGRNPTGLNPEKWAKEAEDRGGGEIFLNSINRDGAACGYDAELIEKVVASTSIPVIACGGVGDYSDFMSGLRAGASAVAAGNIFHFKEMSYVLAKKHLRKAGANVR